MTAMHSALNYKSWFCRPNEDSRDCTLRMLGWMQFVIAAACILALLWLLRTSREKERAAELIAHDVAFFALGALAVLRYHAERLYRRRGR